MRGRKIKKIVSGIVLATLLALVFPLVSYASQDSSNLVANGNFETGTFSGWNVTGVCSISSTVVHSGKYSAYISNIALDSAIDQVLNIPANNSLEFTGWIYPTGVGLSNGYACSCAIRFNFYYRNNMTKAFQVDYMWSGYPPLNSTSDLEILQTSSFSAYTWNLLSRNLNHDILSYFKGTDMSQFVLHDILLYYHYSNADPGPFYADDISLSTSGETVAITGISINALTFRFVPYVIVGALVVLVVLITAASFLVFMLPRAKSHATRKVGYVSRTRQR